MNDNPANIRTFLAVDLSPSIRKTLGDLAQSIMKARVSGLTLVRPGNMHLTLKFFGDMDSRLAPRVIEEMHRVTKAQHPFTLTLGAVGAFPSSRNARVLWIGLDGDTSELRGFHRRFEDAFERLGIPKDNRDFHPHLTIARLNERTAPTDRRRATEALYSANVIPGQPINVKSVTLMKSELRPGGPEYTPLAHVALIGS